MSAIATRPPESSRSGFHQIRPFRSRQFLDVVSLQLHASNRTLCGAAGDIVAVPNVYEANLEPRLGRVATRPIVRVGQIIESLARQSDDESIITFPLDGWSEITVFCLIDSPTVLANRSKVDTSSPNGSETAFGYFYFRDCRTVGRVSALCDLPIVIRSQQQS